MAIWIRNRVREYLKDRIIIVDDEIIYIHGGVQHTSVLGPLLSCSLYNGVLEMEFPEGSQNVVFADDLALLVGEDNKYKVVRFSASLE